MNGMIGRFIYQYGITVTVAVAASYFVAITIAPMLASQFMTGEKSSFILFKWFDAGFAKLETGYRTLIASALRHKGITIIVAFAAFVGALLLFKAIPSEFQPAYDDSQFMVNIEMPQGTSLARLTDLTSNIEGTLATLPEVQNTFTTLGGDAANDQNIGSVFVQLFPKNQRKRSKKVVEADLRQRFVSIPGAKIVLGNARDVGGGAFSNFDLSLELTGNDLDQLGATADKFVAMLKKTPGFRDVDTSYEAGICRGSCQYRSRSCRRSRRRCPGARHNLESSGQRRTAVTTYKEGGDEYDVIARLDANYRDRPKDILSLTVPGAHDKDYELASFVKLVRDKAPSQIQQSKGQRRITINANLTIPLGTGVNIAKAELATILPPGMGSRFTGVADIMRESFQSMGFAIMLGIVLVYLILAAQYEHFVHPLSIMISVPLAFVGAFGLLYLTHMTVSMFSMIGIIMLIGLVTKNAILVIDFTNQMRAKGISRKEALLHAGPIRLRPVLMTTFATIGGMLPVALMLGGGAGVEMKAPMAVAVIGGLITSTFLTLVVVPVVYAIFDEASLWIVRNIFRIK